MNELDESYNKGMPTKAGWYDCLVNGEEKRLLCRYCPSCQKHEWRDINGNPVEGDVLFIPASYEITP